MSALFLSTLSLRRATPHRPPRGGDYLISIHALLAESDLEREPALSQSSAFLSTLSLRRATCYCSRCATSHWHFYPRSPCGERHLDARKSYYIRYFYPRSPCGERLNSDTQADPEKSISIHALLAESDRSNPFETLVILPFLSTLSLRRATAKVHKTVGHFCAYETNFMEIASSC